MAGLPDPGVEIDRAHTALVITDPQNDFLSPEGVTWDLVGESVTENNTVEHIDILLKAAKQNEIQVFISLHYYYPALAKIGFARCKLGARALAVSAAPPASPEKPIRPIRDAAS